MKSSIKLGLCALTLGVTIPASAFAEDHHAHHNHSQETEKTASIHNHHGHVHADTAPINVMGSHMHNKGEWMVSYRYMRMHMDGNRDGTDSISPDEIVSTVTNPNAPPPTLRVVPTEMDMDMHMLGGMYGVTDDLTLMLMAMYIEKDMEHITYQGMMGTTRLGTFTTESSGWGDTSLTALYRLYDDETHHLHLHAGISAPTGSIKEEDDVLTPMGMRMTLRLPYAMQLGSGTWDALPGITYSGQADKWGWGAQYQGTIRMESENDQGYRLGNKHKLTAWGAYRLTDWFSMNTSLSAETQGKIKGEDQRIAAPVQTADPDNYGGETVEAGIGFNINPPRTELKNLNFGTQLSVPVYQNLNGPQMERDWSLTIGLTYKF